LRPSRRFAPVACSGSNTRPTLVFERAEDLAPPYDALVRAAVHAVRAEHVATFLGRKLDTRYTGEVGSDFVSYYLSML
jgi:hypothetical protein